MPLRRQIIFAASWSTLSIAGIAVVLALVLAGDMGCHHTPPQRTDLSKMDWSIQADQPLPTTNRSEAILNGKPVETPVADGTLPLVYLVASDGVVIVRNMTSNQLLATAPVTHNSTVAVDARRGVLVNGKAVAPGPLTADARYNIFYSVPDAANGSTNEIVTAKETNDPSLLRWHYSGRTANLKDAATQSTTRPAPATESAIGRP